jgi:hypothetical protein
MSGLRQSPVCTVICRRSGSSHQSSILKQSRKPQQRQARAGKYGVPCVDSDSLEHVQQERWPAAGHVLPARDVRVQPDRRLPSCDGLLVDLDFPERRHQAGVDSGLLA